MTSFQQNIFRLDVSVDNAAFMGVAQRVGDFAGESDRIRHIELPLAAHPIAQRFALNERHDIIEKACTAFLSNGPTIKEWKDVRVAQVRRRCDLLEKALWTERSGNLRPEHLDRHHAIVLEIPSEIDRRHPALTELALDSVAVSESGSEPLGGRGHRSLRSLPTESAERSWVGQCWTRVTASPDGDCRSR